ncbi:hypothetical protein F2P81_012596 [Scophthalmus maximus]|uniref:Uncharacterized protein n=1 Tax=Scophthalmus maximus TaxID=52904 RepID=A0A6A4SRU0_SCOMX|nr:hypothetical protein F2P81_012596 [Scophthalmus maximus]
MQFGVGANSVPVVVQRCQWILWRLLQLLFPLASSPLQSHSFATCVLHIKSDLSLVVNASIQKRQLFQHLAAADTTPQFLMPYSSV